MAEASVPTAGSDRDGRDGRDDNLVRLVGRITTAPERRTLPSGDEVVSLRLVVRRPDGIADTVTIQVGPAPASGCRRGPGQVGRRLLASTERLTTGTRVRVEGRLRRRWWNAAGARRSVLEVNASTIGPADDPRSTTVQPHRTPSWSGSSSSLSSSSSVGSSSDG